MTPQSRSRAKSRACAAIPGRDVAQDQGRARLEHRELLGRDLFLGFPQPLGVIQADRGEDRDSRVEHVRRVQATAEPCLDHADFDLGISERYECGSRRGFELRYALFPLEALLDLEDHVSDSADCALESLPVDLGATDPHPLGPALGVGRQVRPRRAARLLN